ncbi:hypothetical protein J1N35_035463 [Gossypium stocksii]|uniref:DUF4283 domain-containing protein n=1 Tax=Gossypium stocksii TaxID=47602 RepID=A0A9D3ZR42_9ROSI|nr:hypothetical protein J1N35_035463 [Gossypium stocksii]
MDKVLSCSGAVGSMEDDLANLNLVDEEEEAFQQEAAVVDQNMNLSLVGCCLIDSVVHFPSLRNTMADLWHPIRVDIQRVLGGTPWFFNNHLLLLYRLQPGENPLFVQLNSSEFWVQVHDLPSGLMSEEMARRFGDFLGGIMWSPMQLMRRQMGMALWSCKQMMRMIHYML